MEKSPIRPNIFNFQNHLDYVQKFFEFKRKTIKPFSYAYCARKMQISSGYLKNLFTRRRTLSLNLVSSFAKTFDLNSAEKQFLSILIIRDQVTDTETKKYFEGILGTLRTRGKDFPGEVFYSASPLHEHVLKDSLTHLILSMIKLEGFNGDPRWIQSKITPTLRFTTREIKSRLQYLIEQKVVSLDDNKYHVLDECLSSPSPFDLESFKIYRKGLREVDQALDNVLSYKPCNFFMGQITIDKEWEREALDIFNRCRDQLMELETKSSHPNMVIAISNNLITLCK